MSAPLDPTDEQGEDVPFQDFFDDFDPDAEMELECQGPIHAREPPQMLQEVRSWTQKKRSLYRCSSLVTLREW